MLNPRWKNVWGVSLLVILGYLGLADIWPAISTAPGDTFSEFVGAHPALMLLAGYLAGHFWPTDAALRRVFRKPDVQERTTVPGSPPKEYR